jgi:hypothetical protein
MSPLFDRLSSEFLPRFLSGLAVNFEIAGIAIALGLACGLLLAVARLYGGAVGAAAGTMIALMRAAPTFVVMFFLLNVIPRNASLFGVPLALSGIMAVALSLLPYAAAYIADAGGEALQQLRRGSPLGSLLFLPNVTRAFFVLVMSSSAGAAIGVPEGIAIILRQAEQLPSLGDKLALFAVGIVFFGIPLQAGFAVMSLFQRRLSRAVMRNREAASLQRG